MTLAEALRSWSDGDIAQKRDILRRVLRKGLFYPENLLCLIGMIWNYLKCVSVEKKRMTIDRSVWSTQFMKHLGKRLSVHDNASARTENERLLRQFTRQDGADVFPLPGGFLLSLPPVDNAREIAVNDLREIVVEKIYEYGEVRVRPHDVVLDCGANIGLFSLLALSGLKDQGQLIAIEPVPVIRTVLEKNLSQAAGRVVCRILEQPVFRDSRKMDLLLTPDVFTMHHLDVNRSRLETKGSALSVQTTTIDEMAKTFQWPRVDFIKMDIEGAEMDALAGAATTLKRWKPRLAISAYHLFDDFYEIPRRIYKINPSYHIEVRRGLSPMCYAW